MGVKPRVVLVSLVGVFVTLIFAYFTRETVKSREYDIFYDTTVELADMVHRAFYMDSRWEPFIETMHLITVMGNISPETFNDLAISHATEYMDRLIVARKFLTNDEAAHFMLEIYDITLDDGRGGGWTIIYTYPYDESLIGINPAQSTAINQTIDFMEKTGESDIIDFPRDGSGTRALMYGIPLSVNGTIVLAVGVTVDVDILISSETNLPDYLERVDVVVTLSRINVTNTIFSSSVDDETDVEYCHSETLSSITDIETGFTRPPFRAGWYVYTILVTGLVISAAYMYFGTMYDLRGDVAKQKTMFLANISHEIRTPMNAIITMSDELARRLNVTGTTLECLETMSSSSRYLLDLINNVLDMSKIESRKVDIANQPFGASLFREVVRDSWNMARVDPRKVSGMNIVYENMDENMVLIGDRVKTRQVVNNLMSNALKFSTGGTVDVLVGWKPLEEYSIVSVKVIDHGIGISPQDTKQIFTAFTQVRNKDGKGTGLGLTISRAFAVAMGGNLECESVQGEGSTFTFSFTTQVKFSGSRETVYEYTKCPDQVHVDTEDTEVIIQENEDTKWTGIVALVVDDNNINIFVMSNILSRLGVTFVCCMSGQDALKKCESARYDIIFMDKYMGDWSGMDTTRRIRRGGFNNTTPVVFVTADVSEESRTECISSGGNEFLPKPVIASQVERILSVHCMREG